MGESWIFWAISLLFIMNVIWNVYRTPRWKDYTVNKFSFFESHLESPITEYAAYTNNHPYVWGEINYEDCKEKIIKSINLGPYFNGNYPKVSLRVNEDRKSIYIASGTDKFDWDRLYHYQEWLDSQKGVNENIANYKRKL